MKLTILLISLSLSSCSLDKIEKKTAKDYTKQISKIEAFAKTHNYNKNIAFMIDYSLHSGLLRFFVVDLKQHKLIKKGLVCHGSAKGRNDADYAKFFSNVNESNATSLGFAVVGERAYSKWGKHFKYWLNGLEKTNSKMKDRVVVLHAWSGVQNHAIYPISTATSWGCPTVSIDFLDKLDSTLKKEKRVLLYSFVE